MIVVTKTMGTFLDTTESVELYISSVKDSDRVFLVEQSDNGIPSVDLCALYHSPDGKVADDSISVNLRIFGVPDLLRTLDALNGKGNKANTIICDNDNYRLDMTFYHDSLYVTIHSIIEDKRVACSIALNQREYDKFLTCVKDTLNSLL